MSELSERKLRSIASERYDEISQIPSVVSGKIMDSSVQVTFSQPQKIHNKKIQFRKSYLISENRVIGQPQSTIISSEEKKYGVNYRYSVSFTNSPEGDSTTKKKWSASIWDNKTGAIIKQVKLPSTMHGDIVTSFPFFHGISWNSDQSKFLYLAEKKPKKSTYHWEEQEEEKEGKKKIEEEEEEENEGEISEEEKSKKKKKEEEEEEYHDKYLYDDSSMNNYGEGLSKIKQPRLFECDWKNNKIRSFKTQIPLDIACATPFYLHQNNNNIYFVGYNINIDLKLGLTYCLQRPSILFEIINNNNNNNEKKSKPLNCTKNEWNVIFPRPSPNGNSFVFLTTTKVPYHFSCHQLKKVDILNNNNNEQQQKIELITDIISKPTKENPFPGIYPKSLLEEFCWSENSNFIFINSFWNSDSVILRINLKNKKIKRIICNNKNIIKKKRSSINLLDQKNGKLLVCESNPLVPYIIKLIKINQKEDEEEIIIEKDEFKIKQKFNLDYKIGIIPIDDKIIELIIIKPSSSSDKKKYPLLMFPHGGPHSISTTRFIPERIFLSSSSEIVLVCINYRGSIGFGQQSIHELTKNIGDWDVKDIKLSTQFMIEKKICPDLEIDLKKIGIIGGSHGGFLTLHCLGQYPELFRVGVTRNPVTEISSMLFKTDIPDWCFCETNQYLNESSDSLLIPNQEFMISAFNKSPMKWISKIKAPLLMLIGDSDLRVPPYQGMYFYKCLKRIGKVKTMMKIYPNNSHPLAKVTESADVWISTILWILKYLKI